MRPTADWPIHRVDHAVRINRGTSGQSVVGVEAGFYGSRGACRRDREFDRDGATRGIGMESSTGETHDSGITA
jgi:hypothetical protein